MKRISFHVFLVLMSLLTSAFPQNPEWMQYTCVEDILALAEGGGYIWVGTDVGLYSVNKATGESVCYNNANSGLPHNIINTIAIEDNGDIWIGTHGGGFAKYSNNSWTVYNSSNSPLFKDRKLYAFLTIIGALRIGKAREKNIAVNKLTMMIDEKGLLTPSPKFSLPFFFNNSASNKFSLIIFNIYTKNT